MCLILQIRDLVKQSALIGINVVLTDSTHSKLLLYLEVNMRVANYPSWHSDGKFFRRLGRSKLSQEAQPKGFFFSLCHPLSDQ